MKCLQQQQSLSLPFLHFPSPPHNPDQWLLPSLDPVETDKITDETFRRYYSNSNVKKRNGGNGVSIVWFRNDPRVLDNEALYRAWMSSQSVLPVYVLIVGILGLHITLDFLKLEELCGFQACS
ncbi:hypothetical protein MKW98_017968 [Papaver atlanticum]|uniref:Photolyase/cryptochrome alpha/beta domain-containing protein n=1 Tax=Papaver atlanticum TaxID=357466 RepID=A0AAD4XW13_9MAGN|nr:hypothetical protein MKW98_017968 [Papaver atlanticum]